MEEIMKEKTFARRARADWKRNRALYLLVVPVIIFYIVFHYKPMYGAIIAFKDYTPALGVGGSPWDAPRLMEAGYVRAFGNTGPLNASQ